MGKKSLFAQYLTMSLVTMLLSFVILGTMLVFFVARFSNVEKQNLLVENANQVADLVSEKTVAVNNSMYIGAADMGWISSVVDTISSSINSDIVITDAKGVTVICNSAEECTHKQQTLPQDIRASAKANDIFFRSDLGGMYVTPRFAAVVPITVDIGTGTQTIGFVVVAATESTTFSDFTGEITKIFLYAAIATFAIVACMIWFFSYKMIKPLRQISIAAKKLANEDFSVRVPVTSSNEIGTLAKTFNEMADSLAVSESTRRNFIANVSHELKTPMTTISGFIDGILDGTIPPEKQRQYLRIVSTETKRLSRLVASMLSLSRIDNGELRVKKQEFNLSEVVISTLLTFEQKIEERHIDIQGLETCTVPSVVEGDPDLIHQVVYNLFENAVKFVDAGGYIKVTLTEHSDRTELEIKNSGHGIEPDELMHIFERFYKTDKSRSQDKNGMGLGLYIVKTIMRLHGGDIVAQSIVDEFCSFTLWLPKNKVQSNMHNIFSPRKKEDGATMVSSDGTIISTAQTIEEYIEE
ncbi:MAG: HAMP domain-containing sensor histidine kinase [Acutalibacteraceae bacterium]|nr:HAMP domain-containing sensor histidine kinase [Acutalibacteraceae bacterium]